MRKTHRQQPFRSIPCIRPHQRADSLRRRIGPGLLASHPGQPACYRRMLLILLFVLLFAETAAGQTIVVPEELDMGRVRPGEFSEKPLTVQNRGDAPLVIERITTSCPCVTVSPLSPETATVPPGESLDLIVRYTLNEATGDEGAAIAIYSNDPEMPALVTDLRVFADVLIVVFPPDGVQWGLSPRGFPLSKQLMIGPGDVGKEIELISVTSSVPGVSIESEMVEQTDRRFIRLAFALGDDLPLGRLDATIDARVRVGDEVTDLSIPFKGVVQGDQFLYPPAIVSPKTEYAQGQKISEITVKSSSDSAAPEIVGAIAVGPVKASIGQNAGPDRHVIKVYASDDAPAGPQSATVYVMTTSSDEPIVAVPVYFRAASMVVCEPSYLVLHETGSRREIRVRHANGGPVSVKKLHFETDSLSAEIRESGQAQADRPAIVSVGPAAEFNPSKRSTVLLIETDYPGAERLTVPVMVLP